MRQSHDNRKLRMYQKTLRFAKENGVKAACQELTKNSIESNAIRQTRHSETDQSKSGTEQNSVPNNTVLFS